MPVDAPLLLLATTLCGSVMPVDAPFSALGDNTMGECYDSRCAFTALGDYTMGEFYARYETFSKSSLPEPLGGQNLRDIQQKWPHRASQGQTDVS